MTIAECLKIGTEQLAAAGVAQPSREAASLLMNAISRDRTFLVSHAEYELTDAEQKTFDSHLERRRSREPFQHIVGVQEFYGLDFVVTRDVLIPRPETEQLVETAIRSLDGIESPRFCEIGVGSGCVVVSVLHELQNSSAIAVDISEEALMIGRINATNNGVADRVEFRLSDIFTSVETDKFHAILSNPPYIPASEMSGLQAEVRDFDPTIALTDGGDGLSIVSRIICDAPGFLLPKGYLILEIGIGQDADVRRMFGAELWREVEILDDLQGIPRTVIARLK